MDIGNSAVYNETIEAFFAILTLISTRISTAATTKAVKEMMDDVTAEVAEKEKEQTVGYKEVADAYKAANDKIAEKANVKTKYEDLVRINYINDLIRVIYLTKFDSEAIDPEFSNTQIAKAQLIEMISRNEPTYKFVINVPMSGDVEDIMSAYDKSLSRKISNKARESFMKCVREICNTEPANPKQPVLYFRNVQ